MFQPTRFAKSFRLGWFIVVLMLALTYLVRRTRLGRELRALGPEQVLRRDRAGIQEVLTREALACGEVFLEGRGHLTVSGGRPDRGHRGDHVRRVRVAGLGEVDAVAQPGGYAQDDGDEHKKDQGDDVRLFRVAGSFAGHDRDLDQGGRATGNRPPAVHAAGAEIVARTRSVRATFALAWR